MAITTEASKEHLGELANHLGHTIELATYKGDGSRIYLECMDCNNVLLQINEPGESEESPGCPPETASDGSQSASHSNVIRQEFLAQFSTPIAEPTPSTSNPDRFHTLYEIRTLADGEGGEYQALFKSVTYKGVYFDGGRFEGEEAQRQISEIRDLIRRELEVGSSTEDTLYIRFFDPDHPAEDLPDVVYGGRTWAPCEGLRFRWGSESERGFNVRYHPEGSIQLSSLGRISRSTGLKFAVSHALRIQISKQAAN
jgi:hypothetical protein